MADDAAAAAERLAQVLGHGFSRPEWLIEALTHPSAAPRRSARRRGYERLEFLGDRVLGLVIAELLLKRFPEEAEGALTRRHAELVRRETLAEVARTLGLGQYVILPPGEAATGMRDNPGLLSDACEAVIAALYLDGGLPAAALFVRRHWEPRIEAAPTPPRDPKMALQEWAQARGRALPAYETVAAEGPPHRRIFTVVARVEGLPPASASAPSKRGAEVAAAAAILARLDEAKRDESRRDEGRRG